MPEARWRPAQRPDPGEGPGSATRSRLAVLAWSLLVLELVLFAGFFWMDHLLGRRAGPTCRVAAVGPLAALGLGLDRRGGRRPGRGPDRAGHAGAAVLIAAGRVDLGARATVVGVTFLPLATGRPCATGSTTWTGSSTGELPAVVDQTMQPTRAWLWQRPPPAR
jgi:hypothetical protein